VAHNRGIVSNLGYPYIVGYICRIRATTTQIINSSIKCTLLYEYDVIDKLKNSNKTSYKELH